MDSTSQSPVITHASSNWQKLCLRHNLDPEEATAADVEAAVRAAGLQHIDVLGHLLFTVGSATTVDEFTGWCKRNADFATRLKDDITRALEAHHGELAMNAQRIAAGRELDAFVAERVMGIAPEFIRTGGQPWDYELCPGQTVKVLPVDHYSTDISAAWQVVDRLIAAGYNVKMGCLCRSPQTGQPAWHVYVRPYQDATNSDSHAEAWADTSALAICRAALITVSRLPKGVL